MIGLESREENDKFLDILYISAEIEAFLEYVLRHEKIPFDKSSLANKMKKFCKYLDDRENKSVSSSDIIFAEKYSLKDVLEGIREKRNIAVHQANNLISGYSETLKSGVRDRVVILQPTEPDDLYVGSIDDLHKEFTELTDLFHPIWNMVDQEGVVMFTAFDIDGTQIGEY